MRYGAARASRDVRCETSSAGLPQGTVGACALWLARLVVDVVLAAGYEARRTPLRHFLGIYSCSAATLFYRWRSRAASRSVAPMLAVAAELEARGSPETKARLAGSARRLHRVALFYYMMGIMQVMGITQSLFSSDTPVSRLLQSAPYGQLLSGLLTLAHLYAMVCGLFAYYTMLPVLFAMFGACSALFLALGGECSRAEHAGGGPGGVKYLAAQHAHLTLAARRARLLFADLFAHVLMALLSLPLLGTFELLVSLKDVDSVTLTTFSVIAIIFAPICLAGQALEDASSSVRGGLYAGPWLEEGAGPRRARAHLMLGADNCGARMAVGGLGSLNAASLLHVVQRWFSFLNMLLNTAKA
ncbi:Odorant receptor coreceptor [Frankliniella fusca]|uniref:Odorant receptor coreceptor n=1 Tax=Frankliniella fusca TaxID=407009 RepID=A0AAE1LDQ4_9NEOP|nr:Odorant receptor coreceptor [Frankliniella fusca]